MDQVTNTSSKPKGGGDKHSPQAKLDSARREEQIVALRLRRVSFAAIGRAVGISRQNAFKAFNRARHRAVTQDFKTFHSIELDELEMEQARYWQAIDANKDNAKLVFQGLAGINRVHIRRAKLLGLDAPTKLDVRGMYRAGSDDIGAERMARRAALESLSLADQAALYELHEKMALYTAKAGSC